MHIHQNWTLVKEPGHARVLLRRGLQRLLHQGMAKRRPTTHSLHITKQDHYLCHDSCGILSKNAVSSQALHDVRLIMHKIKGLG